MKSSIESRSTKQASSGVDLLTRYEPDTKLLDRVSAKSVQRVQQKNVAYDDLVSCCFKDMIPS